MTTRILRTIFLTSGFAYLFFMYLDTIEPGVVSDVLSAHLWLLPLVVSGVWWAVVAKEDDEKKETRMLAVIAALLVGLVFGGLVWHNGDMFGDFRLLLALGAVALPMLAYRSLK